MSRQADAHTFPSRADLIRFLTDRTSVSVYEAARILGSTGARVRRQASADGALLPGGLVAWSDVCFALFTVWPRALVLDTLGDAVDLIPHDLHLTRCAWDIPIYLVRAMEEQARQAPPCAFLRRPARTTRSIEDYLADLLHLAIDPALIQGLRRDPAFLAAYHYPDE